MLCWFIVHPSVAARVARYHGPMPSPSALTTGPILSTILRLSLPNALAMLATALVAVAETSYAGRLGTAALAGMALVFPMAMLMATMSAGAMGGAVSSALSRALGARDEARAASVVQHATLIGAGMGLLFMVIFLLFGARLYALVGGAGAALGEALAYSNMLFLGALGMWLTNTFASILRGGGDMKTPSTVLLGVTLLQVLLGGALGLGWGMFPRLGMAGIALGQALAYSAGALYLFRHLRSERARVRLGWGAPLEREMFGAILRVGLLSSVSSLQTVLSVLVVTALIARFGTEALAGYGIGARLEFLLIPITFAIGVACVPMVGMAIGAGNVARARRVAWTGASLAAGIVGAVGLAAALAPDLWSGLFTEDAAVLAAARSYFAWAGPAYAFFGLGLCLYFCAQGAGKVLGPVLAGTLRLAVVALGGWWLASVSAPAWSMYALIGLGMLAYGLAAAWAVRITRW
jgi:putative MATE family efflux protein